MFENKNYEGVAARVRAATLTGLAGLSIMSMLATENYDQNSAFLDRQSDSATPFQDFELENSQLPTATETNSVTGQTDEKTFPIPVANETIQNKSLNNFDVVLGKMVLHPENWIISKEAQAVIDIDTVYIKSLGCSGTILRDTGGSPAGLVAAEHCNLRGTGPDSSYRLTGMDGEKYISLGQPIEIKYGRDKSQLYSYGAIKEFMVSANDDSTHDIAFGAFYGHSAQEIRAIYERNNFTEKDIADLKQGDMFYTGSWPSYQPNRSGAAERQDSPLLYLGKNTVKTAITNETLDLVWMAIPVSKDGATCTHGASGSTAFTIDKLGNPKYLGVLSAAYDFTGKTRVPGVEDGIDFSVSRTQYERIFNVDLSNIQAICGYSYRTPDHQSSEIVQVIDSFDKIPGRGLVHSTETLMNDLRSKFFNNNFSKSIIDGVISVPDATQKSGISWKNRPAIYYFPEYNSAIIASFNKAFPDSLELDYLPDLGSIEIFEKGSAKSANIRNMVGKITFFNSPNVQRSGFRSQDGYTFGQNLATNYDPSTSKVYSISHDINGNLLTYPKIK